MDLFEEDLPDDLGQAVQREKRGQSQSVILDMPACRVGRINCAVVPVHGKLEFPDEMRRGRCHVDIAARMRDASATLATMGRFGHLHFVAFAGRLETGKGFYFYQDGFVDLHPSCDNAPRIRWRVRGAWLEIDPTNDGIFQERLRALSFTKNQIIAVSPTGKRSV